MKKIFYTGRLTFNNYHILPYKCAYSCKCTLSIFINPLYTNGLFPLIRYNKVGIVHSIYIECQVIIFKNNVFFFCLKILFTLTNSVDPDEMQHYAAFHLGRLWLPKYWFRGFLNIKGYMEFLFPFKYINSVVKVH